MKNTFSKKNAQVVLELAAFAAVLLFIVGAIVRQSMSSRYSANDQFRAMRLALKMSYRESNGNGENGGGKDGNTSRNQASVIFIEDRLDATFGKQDSTSRQPNIGSGSGTMSLNLNMPIEEGEKQNEPIMDIFINGIHFPLTTARLMNKSPSTLYARAVNGDEEWDASKADRFYVMRDGNFIIPEKMREAFEWQWRKLSSGDVDIKEGKNLSVDIDQDFKEETIIDKWVVMDSQDGDVDFSYEDYDGEIYQKCLKGEYDAGSFWCRMLAQPRPGLATDAKFITQQHEGTQYIFEEGKIVDGKQGIKNTRKKVQVDLIQREIRLANNTGRFCDGTSPKNKVAGYENPVEVCCASIGCCDAAGNSEKTCMFIGNNPRGKSFGEKQFPVIYVRSLIKDKRGRKWSTDVTDSKTNDLFPR